MHILNDKEKSSHLMPILTSELSKMLFEMFKTFEAFGINTDVGRLELLILKNMPSLIP